MTQSHSATIGFVGLGRMGGPMAANLVTAGYRVRGYDVVDDACRLPRSRSGDRRRASPRPHGARPS